MFGSHFILSVAHDYHFFLKMPSLDDTPMERAFAVADDILRQGVVGISDIIVKPGLINVDFAGTLYLF